MNVRSPLGQLWAPGHYLPNPVPTDQELLEIAGLSSVEHLQAFLQAGGSLDDPALLEATLRGGRPVPSLGEGYVHDLPLRPGDHHDLESRLPDIDFVPETVTDPRQRARLRKALREREADRQEVWRREGQWGGQAPGLQPGQQALLINWQDASEKPLALSVQFSYTIDAASSNVAVSQPGVPILTNIAGQGIPNQWDNSIYAKVEWGSGRANHTAVCDFQQGSMIRVSASWLRVSAWYQPGTQGSAGLPTGWPRQPNGLYGGGGGPSGPPVTASAIVGVGFPTFTTAAARFTRKFQLGIGASLLLDPIPPFASAFGYSQFTTGAIAPALTFKTHVNANDASNTDVTAWQTTLAFAADNTFPLPMGAQFLDTSNTVGNPTTLALIYALML